MHRTRSLTRSARRAFSSIVAATCLTLAGQQAGAAEYSVRCLTEPIGDVYLSTSVAGTLSKINCTEGSFIEAGFVIIELDRRSEELEVERRDFFVANLKAELERSELLLAKTASIAAEEVEKKRAEFRIASAELELAREQLAKRQIVAPIAGVVTDLPLKVGEYCEPPKVLVRVVDSRKFYCVANIEPGEGRKLSVGDPLRLEIGSEGQIETLTGNLVFASPVVDPASGLMRIRAVFDNPDGSVRPGVAGQLYLKP
ncbi:MAG TPA: efflux RND transporter periplasmic adaptor subunit [Opitutaceae bacterium]